MRRALSTQKWEKRRQNFRYSSRQGYASDLRHAAKLSDNARRGLRAAWDTLIRLLRYCEAFVLVGSYRKRRLILLINPNVRQTYATILAYLSDKSQLRAAWILSTQLAQRVTHVVSMLIPLSRRAGIPIGRIGGSPPAAVSITQDCNRST